MHAAPSAIKSLTKYLSVFHQFQQASLHVARVHRSRSARAAGHERNFVDFVHIHDPELRVTTQQVAERLR